MKKISFILSKVMKFSAPLALALAILTANSACYYFSYQPDVPRSLDRYRGVGRKRRHKRR